MATNGKLVIGRYSGCLSFGSTLAISTTDRFKHLHIVGRIGSGKTTLLTNLVIQDFKTKHGVVVIDPKGGWIDELMEFIPYHRLEDVVLFDPTDREWPVGFNVLGRVDPDYREPAAEEFIQAFKRLSGDQWGIQLGLSLTLALFFGMMTTESGCYQRSPMSMSYSFGKCSGRR
jgi:hypothetical protein